MTSSSSYHHLGRESGGYASGASISRSDGYQTEFQDDQVSLMSNSPTRDRQYRHDSDNFGSFLHNSFFPSNQPLSSPNASEPPPSQRNSEPLYASHALDSDLGGIRKVRRSTIPRKPIPSPSKEVSEIELRSLAEETPGAQAPLNSTKLKEWKPMMLRKGFAALLVSACVGLVILLEILRFVAARSQGFSTDNKSFVQLLRYFPTVLVICLGFAWKSLVWDLKLITPYSVLSKKPTSTGIWLDYIDTVEFVSVWKSARNRHWAMFLGLATGLLCGILVPLANSLTFISLIFPVNENINTHLTSQFSFDHTLARDNGSLHMSWDYKSGAPYAALAASRMENGKNPPWTVDHYAFDSVDIAPWNRQNASLIVNSHAFHADFDCKKIGYKINNATESSPRINANNADLLAAGCKPNLQQTFAMGAYDKITESGWLNVTDCSKDGTDIRMLATVMETSFKEGYYTTGSIIRTAATGLLCKPLYTLREARMQVNGSTGDILRFEFVDKEPETIDIGAPLPVIVTYLNNPSDEKSQLAHVLIKGGPWAAQKPIATFENVILYASQYSNRDVFFDYLLGSNRKTSDYISNPDLLESEVLGLSSMILAQVISSFSRTDAKIPTEGYVTLYQRRLLVRISSLRSMQAILLFMGLMCALFCTALRPKSELTEDPGNVAAVSVILSRSHQSVERQFQRKDVSNDGKRWMLSRSLEGGPILEYEALQTEVIYDPNDMADYQMSTIEVGDTRAFKPLSFRWASRLLLILFVSLTIAVLAILLHISTTTGGFVAETSRVSTAWSILPSVILVLLGYCLSSVHGVLESFTPYLTLLKNSGSSTLRSSTHGSIFLMPIKAFIRFGSVVLATSSLIALIFPAVKILAAGLYVPESSTKSSMIQVTINPSLTENFEAMYDMFPSAFPLGDHSGRTENLAMMVKVASQSVEYTSIPQFGVPHRQGALDNLVFSNYSNIMFDDAKLDNPNSHITMTIPAIAVNVSCISIGPENFEVRVADTTTSESKNTFFQFSTNCVTKLCNETLGGTYRSLWTKSSYPSSTSRQYQGKVVVTGQGFTDSRPLYDSPYNLGIGVFPDISGPWTNQTRLALRETKLRPGDFNMSVTPYALAVSCNKAIWEVTVSVELRKSFKYGLDGITTLPWSFTNFDPRSIEYKRQYPSATPLWAFPKKSRPNQYNSDSDSFLQSDTLWPEQSKATNIFELLAAYQQFQGKNLTGLTDPFQLARAVEKTWTSYLVEMITELRPYIDQNYTASSNTTSSTKRALKPPQTVEGTLFTPLTRMKQHKETTIALCVLLALMLLGLLYIFFKFPRESLMANPPTSIAAQMGLLAGSKLVRGLREEKVREVDGTGVWRRRFRLGWWPVNDASGWRWGIDLVEDVPVHDQSQTSYEQYST